MNPSIKDVTICMSVACCPLAEMSISSIKRFYPDIKILLVFDYPEERNDNRKLFFTNNFTNIEIIEDLPESICHDLQLDRLIKFVKTKYFLTCDDDVFMFKDGCIEKMVEEAEKGKFSVGNVMPYYHCPLLDKIVVTRIACYFSLYETETFLKYNMTFKRICETYKGEEIPEKHYRGDTGFLVFSDMLKYDLKYKDMDVNILNQFIRHYGGGASVINFIRESKIYQKCDGINIPRIYKKDINEKKLLDVFGINFYKNFMQLIKDNKSIFNFFKYKTIVKQGIKKS